MSETKFELKNHLKHLVESHAPSGHEAPIRQVIREAWLPLSQRLEQDALGSLIAVKTATQPSTPARKIMLAAHMDEIGMLVRDVVDGFLYITRISGVDNRVMPAQTVLVHGKRPLSGVVASVPPHLLTAEMRQKYPSWTELIVDVGLPAEEVAQLVQIGDLVTVDVPMIDLMGKRVAAKALDNRASVATVTAVLQHLQMMHHKWDVYATATVQEETKLLGAATAAHAINPDIAIALDVAFAAQPNVPSDGACEMGGGPGIGVGPNFHPKLYDKLRDIARAHEIRLQDDVLPANSGTDAWPIQVARLGVPTLLLEVPIRNMHSPVETCDLRDIERLARVLAFFIASLDADFLASIAYTDTASATTAAKG
jgi:tetrahedral aminopeptidase